ncbi:MAG: DJ-1/PfpI family protein [Candidatus Micrarchaeota archaeon]
MKKVLFVIAPTGFRDEELFEPKAVVEEKGFATAVASLSKGTASGKLGGKTDVQLTVKEAKASDFDAVAFIGGPGVETHRLYENKDVLSLAKSFAEAGKVVAAICIAPVILAAAGVLKGKKATAFPDVETLQRLEKSGASCSGSDVVVDGKIVTANGPGAAHKFGEKIADLLSRA